MEFAQLGDWKDCMIERILSLFCENPLSLCHLRSINKLNLEAYKAIFGVLKNEQM